MCLILAKKFGVDAPKNLEAYIRRAYSSNRDAIGIAVKFKGDAVINVFRTLQIDSFMAYLDTLAKKKEYNGGIMGKDCTFLIHARIGTSGNKLVLNCHPFKIDRTPQKNINTACNEHYSFGTRAGGDTTICDMVAHNGVVSEFSGHRDFCDSLLLTTMVFAKIPFLDTDFNSFSGRYAVLRSNQDENVHLTNNFVDLQNGLFASTQVYNIDTIDFNKNKAIEITNSPFIITKGVYTNPHKHTAILPRECDYKDLSVNLNSYYQLTPEIKAYPFIPVQCRFMKLSVCMDISRIKLRFRDVFHETEKIEAGDADLWNRIGKLMHSSIEKEQIELKKITEIISHKPPQLDLGIFIGEVTCSNFEEGYAQTNT
jgi:hypothetical protein